VVGTKEGDTEGDLGDVAMPGFVDILSSVLTVFMFFMMLTAAIMFMLTLELKKNLVKEKQDALQQAVSQEVKDYIEQIKSGKIDIADVKKKAEQSTVLKEEKEELSSDLSKAVQQISRLQDNQMVFSKVAELSASQTENPTQFIILYRESGISISEETQKSIADFVDKIKKQNPDKKVSIVLEAPDDPNAPTLTLSRQLVLGRTMNVRNALLGGKANSEDISIRNLPPSLLQESYQWVRIRVETK
jgi:hypothetical protein